MGAPLLADPLDRELPRPVRAFAFVAILALMGLGPCHLQALGGESEFLRAWRMFHSTADGIVEARFVQRRGDGSEVELDRFRLLGHETRSEAPRELRRIVGMRATWEVAQQLCARLGAGADVRVTSRVGSVRGWEPGYSGQRDLCATGAPTPEAGEGAGGSP
jgi:hypothetical protein